MCLQKADGCRKQSGDRGGQVKSELAEPWQEAEDSLQQQWQMNLLDHIESVQEEVTHRMDFIEKELDGQWAPRPPTTKCCALSAPYTMTSPRRKRPECGHQGAPPI